MQNSRHIYRVFLLCLLTMFLSACGFHLRSTATLPTAFNPLYVQSSDPYGAFTLELRQILKTQHITLVDRRADAKYTLEIRGENTSTSVLSESASSNTKQYILYYTVTYAVSRADGTVVFGPKIITSQRNYTVNENQVLSTDTEQQALISEMQHDTIALLFAQLGSADALSKIQ